MEDTILTINDLHIRDVRNGEEIVKGVTFKVLRGTCLAVVGESGSGKTMTCRAITGLNHSWLKNEGSIVFNGLDLSAMKPQERRKLCGKRISTIMQNGMASFDPTDRMRVHFRETLKANFGYSKKMADTVMLDTMRAVMLKDPGDILKKFPHQLSGGMLQRCMIALTLALGPDLIIADEPTTALDTITQFEVINQFVQLKEEMNSSMIFISHDLSIVKNIADYIVIMKDGQLVERGSVEEIFEAPQHEYTRYLINAKKAMCGIGEEK
jgi:ABC-type dipeptide/oligopeptide/nickel transport system, ATPase component